MTLKEKQALKADYEKAVAAYIKAFCKQMEMRFGHWIGDEVGGCRWFLIACLIGVAIVVCIILFT